MMDREEAIKRINALLDISDDDDSLILPILETIEVLEDVRELLKGQELDVSKYQHKIDHTDCIWYSDSESRCPVTCSQYRDGWNDAMDFIFKNGAGYSPYKRR